MSTEQAEDTKPLPEVPLKWKDFTVSLEKLRHKPYGKKTRERYVIIYSVKIHHHVPYFTSHCTCTQTDANTQTHAYTNRMTDEHIRAQVPLTKARRGPKLPKFRFWARYQKKISVHILNF